MGIERVLLLNPPGRKLYLRDVYCSHSSKGAYLYHPMDLVAQSAILDEYFEISVIDAIAERLAPAAALRRIVAFRPDALLFLTGAVSYREDFAFVTHVKKARPDVSLIGTGDLFLWETTQTLEDHPEIQAALPDFLSRALAEALLSGPPRGVVGKVPYQCREKTFAYGAPRYDLFPAKRYRLPFGPPKPFGSVLTSIGCPYACSLCNMSNMPYRVREMEGLFDELGHLKSLGIQTLFVRDFTFGLKKWHTRAFLERLISEEWNFQWNCFSRADLIDPEILALMKRAGCYMIMYGIESANDEILAQHGKNITVEQIVRGVRMTREAGISVLGTFLLGLPGETEESLKSSIRLAMDLKLDYASFNVASPRVGSTLRDRLGLGSVYETGVEGMDGSNEPPACSTEGLTAEEIWKYRNRAIFKFYLRPTYVLKRVHEMVFRGGFLIALQNLAMMIRSSFR